MIENEFPHMTLMTGDWNAVQSNDIMKVLFGKNGRYKKDYKGNGSLWKQNKKFTIACSEKIFGKRSDIYIAKLKKPLRLKSITKAFYNKRDRKARQRK